MKLLGILVAALSLTIGAAQAAERSVGVTVNGQAIQVPLPEGYCAPSGAYVERQTEADGMYRSTAFPTLRLRPAWFFEDPPPLAAALELARSAAANE